MRGSARRALTVLTLVPLVLGTLWTAKAYGQLWLLVLLVTLATGLASWEYARLIQRSGVPLEAPLLTGVGVLSAVAYGLAGEGSAPLVLIAGVLLLTARHLFQPGGLRSTAAATFGLVYLAFLLHFAFPLFAPENGFLYLATLLGLVWAYDSGAYLVGSRFGRHKLAPAVSPGKSWEGVAGGAVLAATVGLASPLWLPWGLPYGAVAPHALVVALLVSLLAQLGDLFESKLKRAADVKDSGALLPGHGGMLDRVDALLFALPSFYLYLHYALRWL